MKNNTLFYFTDSYPFGIGELWKTNELRTLCTKFEKIYIAPLWFNHNRTPVELPGNNIEVLQPAVDSTDTYFSSGDLLRVFKPAILREIFEHGLFKDKAGLRKCLLFEKFANRLIQTEAFRFVMRKSDANTVWYFFWARGWSDLLPFIKRPDIRKIAVRMHRYDLYLEANNGYIPFRRPVFSQADVLLPVSESGKKYLSENFSIDPAKLVVSRLGTVNKGKSFPGDDGALHLLTCSALAPVKRVDRVIDALRLIKDIPVKWVHIGDGPLRRELEERTSLLPGNISVSFHGKLTAEGVLDYYLNNKVDVLVNTSESEGVPVSIMEAFSASVPVMATNVGGTHEVVDDTVGRLLPAIPTPEEIARELKAYHALPFTEKNLYRERAFARYESMCNADRCAEFLSNVLQ